MAIRIVGTILALIVFSCLALWLAGYFDSEQPEPFAFPVASATVSETDFVALSDSQQSEVVELVRRSLEVNDLRKLHVQIFRLHVTLMMRRAECPELQNTQSGRRMDILLASVFSQMTVSARLLDSISPRLPFTRYTEAVEYLRKLQGVLIRDCGTATGILVKTGCVDKKSFEELPEFSRNI